MKPPASRGGRRALRQPVPFAVALRLDPAPTDRAALSAWPDRPLPVDFNVAASGLVWLTVGDAVVAYRRGALLPLMPGQAPPADAAVAIPEYLPGFALNLAELLPWLAAAGRGAATGEAWAGFVDNPGGLAFEPAGGDRVAVGYREAQVKPAVYRVALAPGVAERVVRQALLDFRDQVLAVNPRLESLPAMAELTRRLRG